MCTNSWALGLACSEGSQQGFASLDEVDYVVLEENGKLSVFPKSEHAPVTCGDMHIQKSSGGIAHPLIIDGKIMEKDLVACGKDRAWLDEQLTARKTAKEQVFLLTLDDNEEIFCLLREDV